MILIKQHRRLRKNGVTIVRSHARAAKKRFWYGHSYSDGDLNVSFPGNSKYTYHGVKPAEYAKLQSDPSYINTIKKTKVYSAASKNAAASFKRNWSKKGAMGKKFAKKNK